MIVLKVDNKTGKQETIKYPRHDLGPIELSGDADYSFYAIVEDTLPEDFNPEKSYYNRNIILTTDKYVDENLGQLDHILIARNTYVVIDYDQSEIIRKLSESVGLHIESNLPLWKQNKYLSRYIYLSQLLANNTISESQIVEITWLGDLDTWSNQCRTLRDERENEYVNNGIFPDLYNWPEMPIKPF